MITALIFAAVAAVLTAGFLFRSSQEAKLATRSFFQSAALNLAEAGIEEGLYAINTGTLSAVNGWSAVPSNPNDYVKTMTTGFDFGQATGAIYVRADGANGTNPVITAAGVITIPNQPTIVKQLRISGTGTRHLFANSIVAKSSVTFSGVADIDSYDSQIGPWNAATNRSDRATVATNSTVQLSGSAYVYGYVATGGTPPSVGGAGRIYGVTSPALPLVDPSRVRTDFNTNLSDAVAPAWAAISLGNITTSVTLPRGGDAVSANGRYLYTASRIDLGGVATLTINGPVDLISTGELTLGNSARILLNNVGGVSLNVYCPQTIDLAGTGLVNNTRNPARATLWGTKPSPGTQTIEIRSSAPFVGTVYAPNANVQLSGSTSLSGALIARSVAVSASGVIHYDVRLSSAVITGGPNPNSNSALGAAVAVGSWSELNAPPGSGGAFARDNRPPFNTIF